MATASFSRLVAKIRKVLISKGERGITRRELNQDCRTKIWKIPTINKIIEVWEDQGLVESFETRLYGGTGPNTTIIRATTKLIDQWDDVIEQNLDKLREVSVPEDSDDE